MLAQIVLYINDNFNSSHPCLLFLIRSGKTGLKGRYHREASPFRIIHELDLRFGEIL